MSYRGHSSWGSYPPGEVQSVYSTTPGDWARSIVRKKSWKLNNNNNNWKMLNLETTIVPVIMGVLGMIKKRTDKQSNEIFGSPSLKWKRKVFHFTLHFISSTPQTGSKWIQDKARKFNRKITFKRVSKKKQNKQTHKYMEHIYIWRLEDLGKDPVKGCKKPKVKLNIN